MVLKLWKTLQCCDKNYVVVKTNCEISPAELDTAKQKAIPAVAAMHSRESFDDVLYGMTCHW